MPRIGWNHCEAHRHSAFTIHEAGNRRPAPQAGNKRPAPQAGGRTPVPVAAWRPGRKPGAE
jgi:hypothetical protein